MMYVVGLGLVKVYKALVKLLRGALSIPLLMSMSEIFPVLHYLLEFAQSHEL